MRGEERLVRGEGNGVMSYKQSVNNGNENKDLLTSRQPGRIPKKTQARATTNANTGMSDD